MRAKTPRSKAPIIITALLVIVLTGGGAFWYSKHSKAESTTVDPSTASNLSQGLKSIEAQDSTFANTKDVKLIVDDSAGQAFSIVRPLENLSAEDQASSKQTLEGGTVTTMQAFGMAKKVGEGDQARSAYNSGYFVYKLTGGLERRSTEAVVKAKAAAEIAAYNQGNTNPDSPYNYANGQVQGAGDITLKTNDGKVVTLPVSKYDQIIKSKANPSVQKRIVRVLAAAKLGDHLLLVSMAVDDTSQFGNETMDLQAMADHVTLNIVQ